MNDSLQALLRCSQSPSSAQSVPPPHSSLSASDASAGWLRRTGTGLLRAAAAALLSAAAWSPAWATLDVKVQANPRPAMPGESVLVSITVSNSDGFNRSGVVMRMPYSVGFANLSHALVEGGACNGSVSSNSTCEPNETVIWDLGTIAAGKSVTVTLSPSVAAATLPGASIPLAIDVQDNFGGAAATSETIDVVNSRVLQLAYTEVTQEPLLPSGSVTLQLTFGHTGSSAVATNAVLELPVPPGFNFMAASDGGAFSGDRVVWNLGTLQPGEVGERRVTLAVAATTPLGSVLRSEAVLSADEIAFARSDNLTRIEAAPGLLLALDINSNPAATAEVLDARLTVSNPGSFDRSGVVVKMRFPVGLANMNHALVDDGDCDGSVSSNSTCEARETLIWNLGAIKAGKSFTVSFSPAVGGATLPGTVIPFTAKVSDTSGGTASANETVSVVNDRVLQLGLIEATQSPVAPGSGVTYQLSFGHTASSAAATNAKLELPVPAGLSFVSASDGGTQTGGKVAWSLGTLNPGQVGERRANFSVAGGLPAGSLLKAEGILTASDGKLVRADVLTRVESAPGLLMALDMDANPAAPGERLRSKLTVSNPSFFDRSNVVARMRLPVGLANLGHALVEAGNCDGSVSSNSTCEPRETVVWDLGTLRAGKSVTVTMPPAIAADTLPGTVLGFVASVSDSSGGRASASEAVEIVNSRVLQLGLSELAQEPALPGSELSYRLSFGHTATASAAANASLELPLPAGLSLISASGGGVLSGGTVRWNLGTLNPAQIGTREVRLSLAPLDALSTGAFDKLEATLSASAGILVRSADTTRIETEVPLGLGLTVSPSPRLPGEAVDVALAVTNNSAFPRSNVVLRMIFPLGLSNLPTCFHSRRSLRWFRVEQFHL